MSGPTTLLARTIDKSRLKPWRCSLCKCEVAAMSLGDGSRISIGSSVAMHVKGKKHLGALQAAHRECNIRSATVAVCLGRILQLSIQCSDGLRRSASRSRCEGNRGPIILSTSRGLR